MGYDPKPGSQEWNKKATTYKVPSDGIVSSKKVVKSSAPKQYDRIEDDSFKKQSKDKKKSKNHNEDPFYKMVCEDEGISVTEGRKRDLAQTDEQRSDDENDYSDDSEFSQTYDSDSEVDVAY